MMQETTTHYVFERTRRIIRERWVNSQRQPLTWSRLFFLFDNFMNEMAKRQKAWIIILIHLIVRFII
jgi:hypothetical protein